MVSPTSRPGVADRIGLRSPLASGGESGFGSQVSCCGGAPSKNRRMHAFPFGSIVAAAGSRAASRVGNDRPKAPSPPTRSHSRRSRPSQSRFGVSRIESMNEQLRARQIRREAEPAGKGDYGSKKRSGEGKKVKGDA